MAGASTLYTSVQYRLVTADHLAAEIPTVAKLVASGAVRVDPNPPFRNQGGIYFEVPQFLEITTACAVPASGTDATYNAMATFKDKGAITPRELVMGIENSAKLAVGGDPFKPEIMSQVPSYWAKQTEKSLLNVIKGAFASGGAMDSSTYFTLTPGTTMTQVSAYSLMSLGAMGAQWDAYRIWLIGPKQYGQLIDAGQVQFLQAGAFGERTILTGAVPTYLGKQIVVDDNMVETDGSTYLLKPNAFYLGFQADAEVEYQRDGSYAGGTDVYCLRCAYMPHLFGLTYGGAAKPEDTTLATAGSWSLSQTTDYKLFRAIKVKFENS